MLFNSVLQPLRSTYYIPTIAVTRKLINHVAFLKSRQSIFFGVGKKTVGGVKEPLVMYSTNVLLSNANKNALPAFQECNMIYQISYHCNSRYVGRTSQRLQDRIKHVPKSIHLWHKDLLWCWWKFLIPVRHSLCYWVTMLEYIFQENLLKAEKETYKSFCRRFAYQNQTIQTVLRDIFVMDQFVTFPKKIVNIFKKSRRQI